jgi:hypothetical protein
MRKITTSGKSTSTTNKQANKQAHQEQHQAHLSNQAQAVTKITLKPSRAKTYETIATIAVNVLLSSAAIAGLVKLIPDQSVQVSKLQALEQEVTARQKTVNCLRDDFSQSFDLGSSQAASLREKGLISSTQRPIRFSEDVNSVKISDPKSCN